jgi:5-methyltetrahydrofolate--homocysteine methyltransferase
MEKEEGKRSAKAKFLIATVKGDVHDIGKNLVDIILTNNGYEVINLGIKQDVNAIIAAQEEHQADCIAMSGLLVKSTAFMKNNLQSFNEAGINVPVVLGGAALTPRFVNKDCSEVYDGKVIYGRDAFTDLRFMDALVTAKSKDRWDDRSGFLDGTPEGLSIGGDSEPTGASVDSPESSAAPAETPKKKLPVTFERSEAVPEEKAVITPFLGASVLQGEDEIPLDEVISFLDRQALFAGQWQMRKAKNQSREDYEQDLADKAEPILQKWLARAKEDHLLHPAVAYGYFPCGREGNAVVVYNPEGGDELGRFDVPRQRSGNRYCIADFYRDLINGQPADVLPMQAVTMGSEASRFSQELFRKDAYSDYLFFHGLAVQMAEALAEWTHARIRRECGYSDPNEMPLREVLAQRYRGSRYSFGYPACPNVADSRQQLEWLQAERIGLTMDESDQLHPEQSASASKSRADAETRCQAHVRAVLDIADQRVLLPASMVLQELQLLGEEPTAHHLRCRL